MTKPTTDKDLVAKPVAENPALNAGPVANTQEPTIARVEVILKQPHTHAGVDYQAGDTIQVRPDQAEALRGQGIIE